MSALAICYSFEKEIGKSRCFASIVATHQANLLDFTRSVEPIASATPELQTDLRNTASRARP
jgi:hypothetical protein